MSSVLLFLTYPQIPLKNTKIYATLWSPQTKEPIMANRLNEEQRQRVLEYMDLGILQRLDGNRLQNGAGTLIWLCGDADQHPHIFREHRVAWRDHHVGHTDYAARLHVKTNNGGPVLLDPEHLLLSNFFPGGDVVRYHLLDIISSCVLKGIHTIALCPHVVCGLETSVCGRDMDDTFTSVVRTKYLLKSMMRNPEFMAWVMSVMGAVNPLSEEAITFAKGLSDTIKVSIFTQFDFGPNDIVGKDRFSLFLSAEAWREYKNLPPYTHTIHIPTL